MDGPPSFWAMLTYWRVYARSLHNAYWLADSVHNLAWFSARDFEGFDEERFWKQRNAEGMRWEFQHFEARTRRQLETGEWMPKSFASTVEITDCFQQELRSGLTAEGYARVEEAAYQLDDFPVDYDCVLAGIELIEKTMEIKMMTGPYIIIYNRLANVRYEEVVRRVYREKPGCWVTVMLLHDYERQRGTLRV